MPPAPSWLPLAPWLFILIWSAGYAVARLALEYTEPLTLLALRFGGALVVLTPFVLVLRPALPGKADLLAILQITLFLQLTHFGCVYIGLELGASAGIMALFAASQPVLVHFASSVVSGRIPSARIWLGLTLGLAGAIWVLASSNFADTGVVLGAALGFLAVVGISIGATIENRKKPRCHRLMNFWLQYAFSTLVSLPLALFFTPFSLSSSGDFLGAWLYLVCGNSLLGIYLLLTLMRYGQVGRVSSIMFLVPAVGALIAWLLLGEKMPLIAWPGVALAALGVLLVLYTSEPSPH